MCVSLSCVQLFVTPWTVVHQAPLSMGYSRQKYWSGLSFPSPRDLPHPRIEPRSSALQADSLPSEPPGQGRREAAKHSDIDRKGQGRSNLSLSEEPG